jgi:hypothetical protein
MSKAKRTSEIFILDSTDIQITILNAVDILKSIDFNRIQTGNVKIKVKRLLNTKLKY